jgi:hypothetical protein
MFYQNNQIHNSLYLTVGNSNEIGKVYQVMEKWVFFKLLLQIQQTHLGVRITVLPKIWDKFFTGEFNESNQVYQNKISQY